MPKVKVYSTPNCPYCKMTKEFLKQHNQAYEDINVAADEKAAREMVSKSGQMGVPVVDIDGKIIVGFDQQKLKKLLNIN